MTARARGTRKGQRAYDAEEGALLELLAHGLSEDEIRRVVACALLTLDEGSRDRFVARLGGETGEPLRGLLGSHGRSGAKARPSPGGAKIRQEWEKAWSDWEACVAESEDEDGRYVIREHHWEQPYLDASSLALDLEPIAARMRARLERVMDEGLAPAFSFSSAIEEMDAEIGSGLPDWMDPSSGDGCALGPEVTGCLLEWEWRARRRDGHSAFELAEAIRKLEVSARIVSLDRDTVARFILRLGDADQKTVLKGIAAHRAAVLGEAHSGWFKIHHDLARRWDPGLFAETSRQHIAQNWALALPLVADLIRRKAFDQAPPLITEAVRALLRLTAGEAWDPRATLLIFHPALRHWNDRHAAALPLLESWRKVATGLGQEEMACALELQLAVSRRWADGDAALAAFGQVPSPRFSDMRDRLFAEWRSLVVETTLGSRGDGRETPGSAWVRALVDAARAGNDGAPSFRRAVRQWLQEMESTPATLLQTRDALGTLTLDLDVGSALGRSLPTLHRLLSRRSEGDRSLNASQRRFIEALGVADLFPEIAEFWRRHAPHLVPDPATANGYYDDCAEWLAAVFELDPVAYQRIVRGWATAHARRKNLWLAIRKRRLPL